MTRTRRWKWWHSVLLVGAVAATTLVVAVVAVYMSLIGGVDELFRGDPPREGDAEVVEAREAAAADLADASVLAQPALRAVGGGVYLGGGQVQPSCRQGQHNWKIDDDFDLVCDLTRVAVVGAPAVVGFRAEMVALHEELLADGWKERSTGRGRSGIPGVLEGYWDKRAGFGTGYNAANLPSASYERTVDGRPESLTVDWAVRTSDGHEVTYEEERAELASAGGSPVSPRELVARTPADGYAVVLSDTVEYFRR